ncbi:MAG: chemotaxis-specific protein-glutamate methyltransferase CheB [Frankiaceae bacterium]|nr:chemotaxis-specific protein-glutamate methyltransferase CheB [Frankiaceae bacterium]MBV9869796.1 chemotaxis-specific protein-glutamate methyltransferase CheB [Frankiaceae bacterium]
MSAQPESPAPVTIVVVDDSATQRRFIRAAVALDPMLEVVGEARTGRDAVQLVERLKPTAVLMDLHLPVMNGIEAIERIMATRPTPIVVYSSFVDGVDRQNAASAYAAGAVDVMAKPGPDDSGRLEEYADALRQRLRVAGRVRVITHPRGKLGMQGASLTTLRLGASSNPAKERREAKVQRHAAPTETRVNCEQFNNRQVDVLAIGASTGGPQALATILADLPTATSTAIVVVQHMADGFMEGLAAWLDDICPLPVVLGEHGKRMAPGTVTVAPSGRNLIVHDRLRLTTEDPSPGQYHVPGVDATFCSVADAYRSTAVGVLLTGMGRDGAIGMKRLRDEGALTIGQDESTSAVYGMPAAAMLADAVDVQLPLPEISEALSHLLRPTPTSLDGVS